MPATRILPVLSLVGRPFHLAGEAPGQPIGFGRRDAGARSEPAGDRSRRALRGVCRDSRQREQLLDLDVGGRIDPETGGISPDPFNGADAHRATRSLLIIDQRTDEVPRWSGPALLCVLTPCVFAFCVTARLGLRLLTTAGMAGRDLDRDTVVAGIKVGTASWTDKTLLDSGWYPAEANNPEKRLRYYAGRFPLVEVDSTYYGLPAERTVRTWADRTPEGFTWNVKAFSLLTGHPTKATGLPKDLRPTDLAPGKNLYRKDVPSDVADRVWVRFLSALRPLAETGKLGAVLFQFPLWFPIGKANKSYILECKARCDPYEVCVEFRNHTWLSDENQEETIDFLTAHAVPFVCVDMPQGYASSVPPVLAATADLSVVRFHGHSKGWDSKDIHERFGYRYSKDELREWAPRIARLAQHARQTHVIMNNCYGDYAQANALELSRLLGA